MARYIPLLLLCAIVFTPITVRGDEPKSFAENELESLVELYRHFHSHPELSFFEKETALRLGEEWKKAGYEVTQNVGGFGVVAILKNGDGPRVMFRTDLDALPVTEETGLVWASKAVAKNQAGESVGVMHACGHDVHITTMVGVARFLARNKDHWSGTAMFIGQPAEERGAGAKAMLEDGLFEKFPKPEFAVALHVDSTLAAGKVGYREGFALANVDSVDIIMHGKGGHGAYPHATVDPIVQAADLVMSLQTIVSREIKPIEPAVVTVGSIHAGTKHNIISNECKLQLTVRSYSDNVRKHLLSAIERKAKAVALSHRAEPPTIEISEGTPSLFNNEELAQRLGKRFVEILGAENVVAAEPSMGGEDFSRYGRAGVPILMYRLGAVEQKRLDRFASLEQTPPSLHSPKFYPDAEPTIRTGVHTMCTAALELLQSE